MEKKLNGCIISERIFLNEKNQCHQYAHYNNQSAID